MNPSASLHILVHPYSRIATVGAEFRLFCHRCWYCCCHCCCHCRCRCRFIQSNSQSNKLHSLFTRTQYACNFLWQSVAAEERWGGSGRVCAPTHITELWANTLVAVALFTLHTPTLTHTHTRRSRNATIPSSFPTQTTVNDAICFFNAILFGMVAALLFPPGSPRPLDAATIKTKLLAIKMYRNADGARGVARGVLAKVELFLYLCAFFAARFAGKHYLLALLMGVRQPRPPSCSLPFLLLLP